MFELAVAVIVAFMLLPILIVVPSSVGPDELISFPPHGFTLRWYREFAADDAWKNSFQYSAEVALASAGVSTVLGVLAALALRVIRRGHDLFRLSIVAPLLVPAIVLGSGLLSFTALATWLYESFLLIVGAHTLWGTPLVFLVVSAALVNVDRSHEDAARNLGANPLRVFFHVTWPEMRVGVLVGALFAFLTSFEEFIMALFVTGPTRLTLPVRIWNSIKFEVSPVTLAISAVLVGIAIVCVLLAIGFGRRGRLYARIVKV